MYNEILEETLEECIYNYCFLFDQQKLKDKEDTRKASSNTPYFCIYYLREKYIREDLISELEAFNSELNSIGYNLEHEINLKNNKLTISIHKI